MKLTFVAPALNMSGGMRVIAIYAQIFRQRGHEVTIVARPQIAETRLGRLKQHLGLDTAIHYGHFAPVADIVRLVRVRGGIRPDDVPDADAIIATWWETTEWIRDLPAAKGRKLYFMQHYEVFDWLPQKRARASYENSFKKLAVAQWIADAVCKNHGDCDVKIIPNGVDHNQFHAPQREKQSRPTIGFAYRTVPFKGTEIAIQVIRRLQDLHPELRVVSFGTEALPAAIGIEHLHYTQNPPQEGIRELYAACDLWLCCSRTEGFNLPALEAMACRTPVVSTRTGWPEEAIRDGENGFLADVDDVATLTARCHEVLISKPQAWSEMSAAAYRTAEPLTWEHSADLFEAEL